MKKYVIAILAFFVIGSLFTNSYVFSYENHSSNKITLIHNYVSNIKQKVELFQKKYQGQKHPGIQKELYEIEKLLGILNNIQKNNLSTQEEEKAINYILKNLKTRIENIKIGLKEVQKAYQIELEKKKKTYIKTSLLLSKQLDSIIDKIYQILKAKDIDNNGIKNYGANETKIINGLKILHKESKKLSNFGDNRFSHEEDMRGYLIEILQTIKSEFLKFKKLGLKS